MYDSFQLKLDNKIYSTTRLNDSNINAGVVPENITLRQQKNIPAIQNKAFINPNSNLKNKIDCVNDLNTRALNPIISKYKNLDYTNYYNQLQTNKIKHLQNTDPKEK